MGGAVRADQSGAVQRETHRQRLDRHIVHHLVVGALQEGRIDRAERLHALGGETGGEGDRVLLGDAHVEAAAGKFLGEEIEPGARRHRSGDGDDTAVFLRLGDQRVGEDLGVGRRLGVRLLHLAGEHIELADAVIFILAGLGGRVALALLGHYMDEDRAVLHVADVF